MPDTFLQYVAAALFALAIMHTFAASVFERAAQRFPRHAGLLHLLGEVEVVFGFWAAVLIVTLALASGPAPALQYLESRQYTEPLFVFVVMVIAASRPVLWLVQRLMQGLANALPLPPAVALVWLGLAAVPLLGSLVTEPAAMTLAALLLAPPLFFNTQVPERLKYLALGTLFVNVSIGGTLTAYAAPPVLMVAAAWKWDSAFMLATFGWKSALAVLVNASAVTWLLRGHLTAAASPAAATATAGSAVTTGPEAQGMAWPVVAVHVALLAGVVVLAHHPVAFLGLFMLFLGFTQAYARYQSPLILKEALLVAFFLAGLVVLGGLQAWWLQPVLAGMDPDLLFFGALALTALTDNAALTYLGSLVPDLSELARYKLVAGAVAGGGLTVIANAPNPAGVALLRRGFAGDSVGAVGLLVGAAGPTLVAAAALLWL